MTTHIGVDTGGTFTDLVGRDSATGATRVLKTPSTPDDPGRAILNGLAEGERAGFWRLDDVALVVHGTTVATNTLLERRGARTALVTTRGFRDVLAIQRQDRPKMYDLRSRRPEPLVPRQWRLELAERTHFDGTIATPIDESDLEEVIERLREVAPEAVAVGLLHSHVNPANENAVGEAIRRAMPGVAVCLSHEIACERGEFERFSTAAANGYVQPVVERYLARLEAGLRSIGVAAPVFVMKSSGGASIASAVARRCVETALSGPAGGVRACVDLARHAPGGNLIAADMGGTSFDVAVVTAGRPQLAREASIGGLPLRVPMLDIHTIGAGGGSLAWVDAGGALRVGPHSAGAQPGPACYGRGGDRPTVTDANLVLGRLAPDSRLAGGTALDLPAATKATQSHLATPLGMPVEEAAMGVLRVANAAMVAALRRLTVERGVDPRRYALCPFGGAGPLHAAELADLLGVTEVLVPPAPGVFSAHGLLLSDLREDRFVALSGPLGDESVRRLIDYANRLTEDARSELQSSGSAGAVRVSRCAAALRYQGQSGDLQVEWPAEEHPTRGALAEGFHSVHRQRFGFDRCDHPIELAGVSVSVELAPERVASSSATAAAALPETARDVWFDSGPTAARIIDRGALAEGEPVAGPAVIEQDDTTIVLPPGWRATPGAHGELRLTKRV